MEHDRSRSDAFQYHDPVGESTDPNRDAGFHQTFKEAYPFFCPLLKAWRYQGSSTGFPLGSTPKTELAELRVKSPDAVSSRPHTNPDCSLLSTCISREQRVLKPAMWVPVLRYPHNWWETWTVPTAEPEECVLDMGRAIEKVAASASAPEGVGGGNMLFHLDSLRYSADDRTGHATMLCITKARWLDIVELKIYKPPSGASGTEVQAHG